MPQDRNLNRQMIDAAAQQPLHFPYETLPDLLSRPEFYARELDDVELIATPFAHDETVRRRSEEVSAEIWREKNRDMLGREAMLLKFNEIDAEYEHNLNRLLNNVKLGEISLSDDPAPEAIKQELAVLFQLADEHEAILEAERKRIEEEKLQRIIKAREFFIRGLVSSAKEDEEFFDNTKF